MSRCPATGATATPRSSRATGGSRAASARTPYRDPWSGDEQRGAFLAEQRLTTVPQDGRLLRVQPAAAAPSPGETIARTELVLLSLQPGVADPLEEHVLRRTAPRAIAAAPGRLTRVSGGLVDGTDLLALGEDAGEVLLDAPPAAPAELRALGLSAGTRGTLTRPAGPTADGGERAVLAGVHGRHAPGSFWLELVPRLLLAREQGVLGDAPVLVPPLRSDERAALERLGLGGLDLRTPAPDTLHRFGEAGALVRGLASARRAGPAALGAPAPRSRRSPRTPCCRAGCSSPAATRSAAARTRTR